MLHVGAALEVPMGLKFSTVGLSPVRSMEIPLFSNFIIDSMLFLGLEINSCVWYLVEEGIRPWQMS